MSLPFPPKSRWSRTLRTLIVCLPPFLAAGCGRPTGGGTSVPVTTKTSPSETEQVVAIRDLPLGSSQGKQSLTEGDADRVPEWAKNAIFYQVFPERFRNGDPSNDPTRQSLEFPEMVPDHWRVTPWTDQWYRRSKWERELGDNFYEHGVFHRRYGGDLQGILDRLDYLADLGINCLYLNPVFYARSLHKYDGNSYHHVDPYFGPNPQADLQQMAQETADPKTWKWTEADQLFLRLIKASHQRDIRVVMDGVFNHTGRDFFAFEDIRRRGKESPYIDWYVVKSFDDPATDADEFKYQCWWGVDTLPEFANSQDDSDLHPQPKAYILQATRRWMDPDEDGDPSDGVDGWRLDVANEVPNKFWRDWHTKVRQWNPNAYTVAEIWEDAGDYLADCGFSATMNYFGFSYPVKGFLIDGEMPVADFAREITDRMQLHPRPVRFAMQNLVDGHDTDRMASMIVNRPQGKRPYVRADRFDFDITERSSARNWPGYRVDPPTENDRKIQRLVALFQMTFVGAPMIYYGTETGMDGGDDPDDRMPMVWDDLTYESRTLGPSGQHEQPAGGYPVQFNRKIHDFYRQVIHLRKEHSALRGGTFYTLAAEASTQALVFERQDENEQLVIAINRSAAEVDVRFSISPPSTPVAPGLAEFEPTFCTSQRNRVVPQFDQGQFQVTIPAMTGYVWKVNRGASE